MRVEVLLFGAEREAAGSDRAVLEVPGPHPTCADLRQRLQTEFPSLRPHLATARFAINGEFAALDQDLTAGDEVALIGLVSGG